MSQQTADVGMRRQLSSIKSDLTGFQDCKMIIILNELLCKYFCFFICYSFIIYSLLHWVFVAPFLGELGLLFVVVHGLKVHGL